MGFFSSNIKTMDDLFLHGLQDIYYAEQQVAKALPRIIKLATNRALSSSLSGHLEETGNQIKRLEQVFKILDQKAKGASCPAIDGILKEADEVTSEVDDKSVLDAAIIANSQAVEDYEIARYGTLIAWAQAIGQNDVVHLLMANLAEEKAADEKLTSIACQDVNITASGV